MTTYTLTPDEEDTLTIKRNGEPLLTFAATDTDDVLDCLLKLGGEKPVTEDNDA
jgi:hypothetical protein